MKKNNTIKVTSIVEEPDVTLCVDGEGAFLIDTSVTGKITVTRFDTDLAYCSDEFERNGYVDIVSVNRQLLAIDKQELDISGYDKAAGGTITVIPVNAIIVTTEDSGSNITEFTVEQPNNQVELLNEGQYLFAIANGACHVRQIGAAAGGGVSKEYVDQQVATRSPKLYERTFIAKDANGIVCRINIISATDKTVNVNNKTKLGEMIGQTDTNGVIFPFGEKGFIKITRTAAAINTTITGYASDGATQLTITSFEQSGSPRLIG